MGRILTPAQVLAFDKNEDLRFCLEILRDGSQAALRMLDERPSGDSVTKAVEFLSGITDLDLNDEQVGRLLDLYPRTRIALIEDGGLCDTGIREQLSDMVATFFVGCTWPTYGDNVDVEAFQALLRRQAVAMGYMLRRSPNS